MAESGLFYHYPVNVVSSKYKYTLHITLTFFFLASMVCASHIHFVVSMCGVTQFKMIFMSCVSQMFLDIIQRGVSCRKYQVEAEQSNYVIIIFVLYSTNRQLSHLLKEISFSKTISIKVISTSNKMITHIHLNREILCQRNNIGYDIYIPKTFLQ